MEEVATITSAGKQLKVIYSKMEQGLYLSFSSDERLADYILREPELAFCEAVIIDEKGIYWLNIASTEDFGYFDWKGMPDLLERQLVAFTPIIQKFIKNATAGKL